MKELNFLKRLSAITLAAAITAANVGFDFLPTAKKAAAEPKEENTVTEVKGNDAEIKISHVTQLYC